MRASPSHVVHVLVLVILLASCRGKRDVPASGTRADSNASTGVENRPVATDSAIAVTEASAAIDVCYHWAGEAGDQSDERNRQIEEGLARNCPDAERKARAAYRLYPKSPALAAKILELIDIAQFALTDVEKGEICEIATPRFREDLVKSGREDALFRGTCPEQAATLYGK